MEFTQEIAVLQSAIVLAEKKCGCLYKLSKGGEPKTLVIITDAIMEIFHGLRGNLDVKKQDEVQFKMTTILLALYLTDKEKPGNNEFWFSILQEMSAINTAVLFDVVKKCHLQQQLFTVLNYVCPQLGLHILADLVDYLGFETDDLDILLWVDLLEYLFLIDNPYLYKPDNEHMKTKLAPHELDICTNLSKLSDGRTVSKPVFALLRDDGVDNAAVVKLFELLHSKLSSRAAGREHITYLMCAANALASMVSGWGVLADHTNYLAQPLGDFLKEKSLRNTFSPSEAQALFLQTQDEILTKGLVRTVLGKLKADSDTVSALGDIILELTEKDGQVVNLNALIDGANTDAVAPVGKPTSTRKTFKDDFGKLPRRRIISVHHCCMVLKQVSECKGDCVVVEPVVSRCRDVLSTPVIDLVEQLAEKKWDWCRVAVSTGLQGHKEFFKECLDDDIPPKLSTKWIDFVEKNLQVLGSAGIMKKWLQFVSRFIFKEKKSMAVTTIRMITLAAYRKLPLSAQAEVILHAHTHVNMKPLFEGGTQLQMKMTTAFNRLVKAKGNVKTSVGAVSELILQSPRDTLHKIVHDAVYNNGVTRMMAEILESLPTVRELKSKDGVNLLGHLIGQATGWKLTRAEEQNLLSFIKHLFELSTADSILLDRAQVMQMVVLPNLGHSTTPDTGVPLTRILGLAQVVLGMGPAEWMESCGPAPLLLCLVGMLEDCGQLYGGESCSRKSLKEQLVVVINTLIERLAEQKGVLTGKCLTWLYNSMVSLHWTGLLHLAPLFSTMPHPDKYPMRVPALVSEVAVLPEGWVTFPHNGQGDAVYLALEAVRVAGVGKILQPVDEAQRPAPHDRYVRGIAALAMLLPDSLACECEEMVSWLLSAGTCHRLGTEHILSYSPTIGDDCEGVVCELSACRLLHDVLRVISDGGLRDAGPEVNLHVAQTHVVLLKTYCLRPSTSAPCGALCVLLTELFCRLCHQMALFSVGCGEPIYVLLLDVLQTYGTARAEVQVTEVKGGITQESLNDQVAVMTTASELCSPEEQSMLGKTLLKHA